MQKSKKLIDLVNKYRPHIDPLEDLYSEHDGKARLIDQFIQLILNYRLSEDSWQTSESLEDFDDVDKVEQLESLLNEHFFKLN